MEHIPSDIKNIKSSLCQMTNYILNKKVERGKLNDFENLKGISNVAWDFISAIYESGWDVLIADSNNASFRNKVVAKFILKINNSNISKNNSSKSNNKLATINKLPPPIPAKSPKEVKRMTNQREKKPRRNYILKHHLQSIILGKF